MFNWQRFLEEHRLGYVTHGHNVAPGNIAIPCPFCRDDPSEHMGLSLSNGYWGCWRNEDHRGRSPVRLIQALLKCSRLQAEIIAGKPQKAPLDDFDQVINSLSEVLDTETKVDHIRFPPNVKTLVDKGMGTKFVDYLVDRDYTREEARLLSEVYWLMYSITGPFAYRIILPIEMPQGLVTWTGRDITNTSDQRYKTLSKEESVRSIKDCLFGFKSLLEDTEANTLIVCEGPFDAMRLDFFGYPFGIRATCLFGLQAQDSQVSLLSELYSFYKHRYVCLDNGADILQTKLLNRLEFLDFQSVRPPEGYKDPGDLPKPLLNEWFKQILSRHI